MTTQSLDVEAMQDEIVILREGLRSGRALTLKERLLAGKFIDDALSSEPAVKPGDGWKMPRPISEALKDGTDYLVFKNGHAMGIAAWFKDWSYSRYHPKPTDGWVLGGGAIIEPTHFVDLGIFDISASPIIAVDRREVLEEAAAYARKWKSPLRPGTRERLWGQQEAAREISEGISQLAASPSAKVEGERNYTEATDEDAEQDEHFNDMMNEFPLEDR